MYLVCQVYNIFEQLLLTTKKVKKKIGIKLHQALR